MEMDIENRPIRIFTLGRFEILREGDSVRFVRKVQRKPLELLKAIISFGGKKVPEDQITDTLWPDAEGDMAHQSFETTLYRLRRLLGNDMVIVLQGGQLTLDDKYCWLDTWAFDQICEKMERFSVYIKDLFYHQMPDIYGRYLPGNVFAISSHASLSCWVIFWSYRDSGTAQQSIIRRRLKQTTLQKSSISIL